MQLSTPLTIAPTPPLQSRGASGESLPRSLKRGTSDDTLTGSEAKKACRALKYYSANIIRVNRFVAFHYLKPRKISLRRLCSSNT